VLTGNTFLTEIRWCSIVVSAELYIITAVLASLNRHLRANHVLRLNCNHDLLIATAHLICLRPKVSAVFYTPHLVIVEWLLQVSHCFRNSAHLIKGLVDLPSIFEEGLPSNQIRGLFFVLNLDRCPFRCLLVHPEVVD